MTIDTTTEVRYLSGHLYVIAAYGGALTVRKRFVPGGAWIEVSGSPIADGEERFLQTGNEGDYLQLTPSTSMQYTFERAK
jgi:hypothetical protein